MNNDTILIIQRDFAVFAAKHILLYSAVSHGSWHIRGCACGQTQLLRPKCARLLDRGMCDKLDSFITRCVLIIFVVTVAHLLVEWGMQGGISKLVSLQMSPALLLPVGIKQRFRCFLFDPNMYCFDCSSLGRYYNAYCSMTDTGYIWTQPTWEWTPWV